jgi:ribosomal protein S8
MTKLHLQVALGLYKEGFLSSIQRGDLRGPDKEFVPTTHDNVSTRRLWIGMKYHNHQPVLKNIHLVSHPNRRVVAEAKDIIGLASGKSFRLVVPPQIGEVMFIRLRDQSVVELQEAAKKHLGGEIICRAN